MEKMIYSINGEVDQHICMKINEDFAFPEKIKLARAVLYTFQPKPRKQVWKDGTGKVQKTWTFTPWLRVYDEDGDCGEGPVTPADHSSAYAERSDAENQSGVEKNLLLDGTC